MLVEIKDAPIIKLTQVPRRLIIDLRRRVLQRDDLPGDDYPTTWHFAAFPVDASNRIVGAAISCVSYMFEDFEEHRPAWRLHALATDSSIRGHRIGFRLLKWSEDIVAQESTVQLFWCTAREKAISTYEMNGWVCVSDFYDRPPFGRYRKMCKEH